MKKFSLYFYSIAKKQHWGTMLLMAALFLTNACSSESENTGDEIFWGGDKGDSFENNLTEDQLREIFGSDDRFPCGNLVMENPIGFKADDSEKWETLSVLDGKFIIHYQKDGPNRVASPWLDLSPRDGHPDFVNQVAFGAEKAFSTFVTDLGYQDYYNTNIFIVDMGNRCPACLGYETNGSVYINHDALEFRVSRQYLRAVVAHEYFHVLQSQFYGYDFGPEDKWFTEGTANWAENKATNFFSGFVGSFERDRLLVNRLIDGIEESLMDPTYAYDTFLFFQFLEDRFSDANAVKRVFELNNERKDLMGSLEAMTQEQGSNFLDTLQEYFCWNYLVGSRDDKRHYHDGAYFFHGLFSSKSEATHKDLPLDWQEAKNPPKVLGVNYLEFDLPSEQSSLVVEVEIYPILGHYWSISTLSKNRMDGQWSIVHQPPGYEPNRTIDIPNPQEISRVVVMVELIVAGISVEPNASDDPGILNYRYRAF